MSHKGYNVKKAEQTEMRMISTRPLFEKNIFILHFSFSPFASFDVKAEKRLIQHLPCLTLQTEAVLHTEHTGSLYLDSCTSESLPNQDTIPSSYHTRYCSQNVPAGVPSLSLQPN